MLVTELYKRFPVLVTCWAFMEVMLFAGMIFGWASLVFILKEEGFYVDACSKHDLTSGRIEIAINSNSSGLASLYEVDSNQGSSKNVSNITDEKGSLHNFINQGCAEQESKLNLWFSIAVSFMYLTFTGIGYLIRFLGTRTTRFIFYAIYLTGTMCLAFATPETPWLLLPGLACMGTGGLTMLATNLQVADLHPHLRGTIVAIFTGLFDFSSVNKQLIRIAFESGIARRSAYIFYALLFAIIIAISTCFFLPVRSIDAEHLENIKRRRRQRAGSEKLDNLPENALVHQETDLIPSMEMEVNGRAENEVGLLKPEDKDLASSGLSNTDEVKPGVMSSILTLTFILHLFWLFVHAVRFVTFIGLMNVWLEKIYQGDEAKVGEMLGIYSYMTMGAIGTALLCGSVYDYIRKKYLNSSPIKRVYVPVVLPMCLVICYSMATTVMCMIPNVVAPYIAFTFFTFLRSALFTVAVAFVGDAFPVDHFGVMFGFLQMSAGIAGLAQYPLFQWFDAYAGSALHLNIMLLVLQALTFIHPIILYIRGTRDGKSV